MTNDTTEPTSDEDEYLNNIKLLSNSLINLISSLNDLGNSDHTMAGITIQTPVEICVEILVNSELEPLNKNKIIQLFQNKL